MFDLFCLVLSRVIFLNLFSSATWNYWVYCFCSLGFRCKLCFCSFRGCIWCVDSTFSVLSYFVKPLWQSVEPDACQSLVLSFVFWSCGHDYQVSCYGPPVFFRSVRFSMRSCLQLISSFGILLLDNDSLSWLVLSLMGFQLRELIFPLCFPVPGEIAT